MFAGFSISFPNYMREHKIWKFHQSVHVGRGPIPSQFQRNSCWAQRKYICLIKLLVITRKELMENKIEIFIHVSLALSLHCWKRLETDFWFLSVFCVVRAVCVDGLNGNNLKKEKYFPYSKQQARLRLIFP